MAQDLRERYINFFKEEVFTRLFEQAEIAKFSKRELQEYEESLKAYRDWYSVTKTSFDKGVAEGIEQGKAIGVAEGIEQGEAKKARAIALNMISIGLPNDIIAQATGLSVEDVNRLRK